MLFAQERLERILDTLKKDGKVKVKELSTEFHVTEDCIRKDFTLLEKKNLLKRTYGGAVQIRETPTTFEVMSRKQLNVAGKKIIAQKAFEQIKDGETIFLDISTSNTFLANLLIENSRKVTLVTNMLEVINMLGRSSNISLIAVGGTYNNTYDGFVGVMAIDIITKYKFDRTFVGVVGIDVFSNAITTYNTDDGFAKSVVLAHSKKKYLLCEEKKFLADANFKFAELNDIDVIICDKQPSNEIIHRLEQHGIKLL